MRPATENRNAIRDQLEDALKNVGKLLLYENNRESQISINGRNQLMESHMIEFSETIKKSGQKMIADCSSINNHRSKQELDDLNKKYSDLEIEYNKDATTDQRIKSIKDEQKKLKVEIRDKKIEAEEAEALIIGDFMQQKIDKIQEVIDDINKNKQRLKGIPRLNSDQNASAQNTTEDDINLMLTSLEKDKIIYKHFKDYAKEYCNDGNVEFGTPRSEIKERSAGLTIPQTTVLNFQFIEGALNDTKKGKLTNGTIKLIEPYTEQQFLDCKDQVEQMKMIVEGLNREMTNLQRQLEGFDELNGPDLRDKIIELHRKNSPGAVGKRQNLDFEKLIMNMDCAALCREIEELRNGQPSIFNKSQGLKNNLNGLLTYSKPLLEALNKAFEEFPNVGSQGMSSRDIIRNLVRYGINLKDVGQSIANNFSESSKLLDILKKDQLETQEDSKTIAEEFKKIKLHGIQADNYTLNNRKNAIALLNEKYKEKLAGVELFSSNGAFGVYSIIKDAHLRARYGSEALSKARSLDGDQVTSPDSAGSLNDVFGSVPSSPNPAGIISDDIEDSETRVATPLGASVSTQELTSDIDLLGRKHEYNEYGERLITATPQLRQRSSSLTDQEQRLGRSPSLTVQKQSLSSNPNRSSSTTNIAANVSTLTQQQQALKNELIKAKDKITRNYENAKKKIRDKHQLNIFARQPKYKQAKEIQEKLLDRMYGGNQYEQYLSIPQKITDQYQEAGYTYDKRTEKWYSPQVYDKIKTQLDLQDKLSEKKDSVESTIDRLSKIKENLEDVERRIQYPGAYSDLSRIKSQVQDDIKKIDDAISQMSDYIDNLNLPLASLDRSIGKITTLQENMDNTYDNFKEVQENAIKSERQARDSKQKAIDAKQTAKEAEQASYSTRAIEEAQRNAQEAEEMAREMEIIAREAEMKAQEAEEMAREMEIIAREAEEMAIGAEEWMKSIEARLSGLRAEFDTMWINDIEARLVELQLNDVPETQKEKEKVPAAPELAGWRTGEQGANIHGASAPDSKNKPEGWSNYINHKPPEHGSYNKK